MKPIKSLTLAAAMVVAFASTAQASPIRFGSVADFAPYNYLDDEGVLQGYEAELNTLLCQRAQLDCVWELAPWPDMVVALQNNEFDVIMTGMQITDVRKQTIDFSAPYFPADPSAIMTRTGGHYPDSASVVGTQADTLQADYVNNHGWALASYDTPEDAVQALRDNNVSSVVGDQTYLDGVAAAEPGAFAFVARDVVIGGGVGLGFRKSDTGLKDKLDAALASLKSDGTLDALIGKWFNGRDPNYRGAATN